MDARVVSWQEIPADSFIQRIIIHTVPIVERELDQVDDARLAMKNILIQYMRMFA